MSDIHLAILALGTREAGRGAGKKKIKYVII